MTAMANRRTSPKTLHRSDDFYRAFLRLDRERRWQIALRILRNQKILRDLYDHLLIQEALREPGRNTPWKIYLARKISALR